AALLRARHRLSLRRGAGSALGAERDAVRALAVLAADRRVVSDSLALDLPGHLEVVQRLRGQRPLDPADRERDAGRDRRVLDQVLADLLDGPDERTDRAGQDRAA